MGFDSLNKNNKKKTGILFFFGSLRDDGRKREVVSKDSLCHVIFVSKKRLGQVKHLSNRMSVCIFCPYKNCSYTSYVSVSVSILLNGVIICFNVKSVGLLG